MVTLHKYVTDYQRADTLKPRSINLQLLSKYGQKQIMFMFHELRGMNGFPLIMQMMDFHIPLLVSFASVSQSEISVNMKMSSSHVLPVYIQIGI